MLKYLFTAKFSNGKIYHQNADDRSLWEPDKRSCFYDVLQMEKEARVLWFELEDAAHRYTVDLTDGHFEVDGIPFRMHEGEVNNLQLIFFRQHTHSFTVGQAANKEIDHQITYSIGWQTTVEGKNKKSVMQIK